MRAYIVGRRSKYVVAALFVLVSGLLLSLGVEAEEANGPSANLPDSAESTTVAQMQKTLPSSGVSPVFIVLSPTSTSGEPADSATAVKVAESVQRFSTSDDPLRPAFSEDKSVALVVVPLKAETGDSKVEEIRSTVEKAVPNGIKAEVTGGPAFQADLADVFAGADIKLLLTTASVVALLLLITYRSPWLWLVPLSVVGVADRVASIAVAGATKLFGFTVDGSTVGITSVLVFGAGTNYALLLIARYREELRRHDDRHEAMRAAWRQAAPAILASAGTVMLALLTLSFADTPSNRALGYSGTIGIAVAVIYGLVVLPSMMVLFGRKLFWPFVPRAGQDDPARTGVWARIGSTVVARPRSVALAGTAVLVVLALAGAGISTGLTQNERFRTTPESVKGQETLASAFPAGAAEPTVVLTDPEDVEAVQKRLEGLEGIASVSRGPQDARRAQLNIVIDADRGSDRATATVERLRNDLGGTALVGGPDAQDLDARTAATHDQRLIIPLVLLIVMVVLLVLLRSIVAAFTLVLTVVATYVSAMGIGWFVSDRLFGFPALDLTVPLFSFIFLVALGVDYNIFLTTRAREEAREAPIGRAMTTALAVTGGVITSAGILLAAVFAVLGVLPLITLTQIGIIVGFGVLLDTLLVRSLLVPALATAIGEKFWWPSSPSSGGTS